MTDERALQEYFVSAFEHLKSFHSALSTVMCDVAALRETIVSDTRFAEIYEKKRKAESERAAPLVLAALKGYDQIIRGLKGLEPEKEDSVH